MGARSLKGTPVIGLISAAWIFPEQLTCEVWNSPPAPADAFRGGVAACQGISQTFTGQPEENFI